MKFNLHINIKSICKVVVLLYIVGAIMLLFGLMNVYNVHQYILGLLDAGQIDFSQQFSQVLTSYVEAILPYVFYTSSLFGIGYVITCLKKNNWLPAVKQETVTKKNEITEEDIDIFLRSIHE